MKDIWFLFFMAAFQISKIDTTYTLRFFFFSYWNQSSQYLLGFQRLNYEGFYANESHSSLPGENEQFML
jgi:hypothetical protein